METEYDDAGNLTDEQEAALDSYYATAKIDALIAERDALWARYDAAVATAEQEYLAAAAAWRAAVQS